MPDFTPTPDQMAQALATPEQIAKNRNFAQDLMAGAGPAQGPNPLNQMMGHMSDPSQSPFNQMMGRPPGGPPGRAPPGMLNIPPPPSFRAPSAGMPSQPPPPMPPPTPGPGGAQPIPNVPLGAQPGAQPIPNVGLGPPGMRPNMGGTLNNSYLQGRQGGTPPMPTQPGPYPIP